ncbi:helix-turn-helix domain-containing protein [Crossiella sp. CA-258035]|uniref:helix-turn-helix domain-containing protein n=1 Tax=Crossiella sp. CA-258035 TaxID=2981138 RepID=UPI0024BCC68D|nr:helix-turn-helix domain-containing protein [Crossiella sp. CA-258035]WHT15600.1 helix-turn-helix domain-containing protein [Crossiella sp. CA-258035]
MDTLDLLLHPVRLRITWCLSGGRTVTTSELCAQLPDVPKTTVYRHVGLLAEGGVLEVADERRVHGAVERHYRLRQDRTKIDDDEARAMSLDDHRRLFTAAMAALLAEFNGYLDREGADPATDLVGYKQGTVWLSEAEMADLAGEVVALLRARAANQPTDGRRPYLISPVFFPLARPETPASGA